MTPVTRTMDRRAGAAARWAGIVVAWALVLTAIPCAADGPSTGDGFEVVGRVADPDANLSIGGSFQVQGTQVLPANGLGSREFALDSRRTHQKTTSGGCPCQGLFADGFESGDLGAWDSSV